MIDSRFVFYVVAEVINGAEGDRPGLYQIVAHLIAGLSGFCPANAGPMRFEEGRNLYTEQQGQHGVLLYGTYFTCDAIDAGRWRGCVPAPLSDLYPGRPARRSPPLSPYAGNTLTMNDTNNALMRFPNPHDLPMIFVVPASDRAVREPNSLRMLPDTGPGCRAMASECAGCVSRMCYPAPV